MDLLEQPAAADTSPDASSAVADVADVPDTDAGLLGLPPGVSAPEGVATTLSPAAAAQVQWYHLDPDENYQELRVGGGVGMGRGLAFGGLLSILAIGMFYACMWLVEPSAMLLNPFVDRSYSEARENMAVQMGGLAPIASFASAPGTTQPAAAGRSFDLADLRSAHRPSAGGDTAGGTTWYRFDLPREQVPQYREHLIRTWIERLKHRVEDGRGDPAFDSAAAPPFWEAGEFDADTRIRLMQSNGDVSFHAAFSATRGRVYIRVNH